MHRGGAPAVREGRFERFRKTPKRKTKKYITEVRNYAINDAKWKNAIEYCKDRNMEFIIITEDELGI